MGLLNLFSKSGGKLFRLHAGSFTVDRDGRVLVSTLPGTFPKDLVREIGSQVLEAFRTAQEARLPLTEVVIRYSSLKLTARELRGGAIIFLAPRTFSTSVT